MSDGKDSVISCLFSGQDMKVRNVRFCRGSDDVITEGDLSAEFHAALVQKRDGLVKPTGAPKSERPKVNIRELVAST
jgi:hypothetical protein